VKIGVFDFMTELDVVRLVLGVGFRPVFSCDELPTSPSVKMCLSDGKLVSLENQDFWAFSNGSKFVDSATSKNRRLYGKSYSEYEDGPKKIGVRNTIIGRGKAGLIANIYGDFRYGRR